MWTITLRDLQFRGRQFGIAVAGAALVFALALELTGISAGFRTEARTIIDALGADAWVVEKGSPGPFTSQQTLPSGLAVQVARSPGVREARSVITVGHLVRKPGGDQQQANIIGHDIGRLGDPLWGEGGSRARRGQVVVDKRLGVERGDVLRMGEHRFRVADVVEHRTYFGGVPVIFMSLGDARLVAFGGRPFANAVLVQGTPRKLPRGYAALTNAEVRGDMLTPLDGATTVIDTLRVLMWIVAALIIGAVTYLSALERVRDFAVLKAVGGSSRDLAASLAVQAVISSLAAAALGAGIALVLRPAFPVPVTIDAGALIALPLIAAVVGMVASLAALRRAVRVDPALAFAS